ncbi:DNA-directed DNA polymerase [Synchytrium endobioticum]|uniref:DNA-directed DNA polymerase n=1 Tax=Synchytrium endobioticum TaxID=286115 RepID=A0A507CKG8_9FUNG|nr:DNA-directed DNA polymerase [Synchytrium endobioticum]
MIDDVEIPNSYLEALRSPFAEDWIAAMKEQHSELLEKETWELVDAPPDSNVISGRWVFNVKRDRSGNIERLKARWVGRGFTQKYGLDYDQTFAPTSHLTSVRVVLTIAAIENLEVYQLDIKTAFLNARLDPAITVYVEQPHGFAEIGQETKVCRLKKALYGLKEAPKEWHETLKGWMLNNGFTVLRSDELIYIKRSEDEFIVVLVHVDDMLVGSRGVGSLNKLIDTLRESFDLSAAKPVEYFLGIGITRDRGTKTICLQQKQYIKEILREFGMEDAHANRNPFPSYTQLYGPWRAINVTSYQCLVGKLLYLSRCSRPDIAAAVSVLCQFTSQPLECHWALAKDVLRHLKGTLQYRLKLGGGSVSGASLR